MPAPTSNQFEVALTNALLAQGFVKMVVDPLSGKLVPAVPPQLPDYKAKEVKAQAVALAQVWAVWQATQVVTVPGITTGPSVAVGTLAP